MTSDAMFMQPPDSHGQPPLSDSRRQQATRNLMYAHRQGHITSDELAELLNAVEGAATEAELALIPHASGHEAPAAEVAVIDSHRADDDIRLPAVPDQSAKASTFLATKEVSFGAVVPPYAKLTTFMGTLRIDLREIALAERETVFDIFAGLSDVVIHLGPGMTVIDEMDTVLADVKLKGLPASQATHVIRLRGRAFLADIFVYGHGHSSIGQKIRDAF